MYLPADILLLWLCLALLWLCTRQTTPAPTPPAQAQAPPEEGADLTGEPPAVGWLALYQTIAIARGDWQMADYYRDEADRLRARQEARRLCYNQALRNRILKG